MQQLYGFRLLKGVAKAERYSLANSAGICLGPRYAFDLTRPGLALYGGIPVPSAQGHIAPVVKVEAQVLQVRTVAKGETIGYGATFTARSETRAAILNLGYADGYLRSFAGKGHALIGGAPCPLLGRVSMDLIAVDVTAVGTKEGDWLEIGYDLVEASALTGLSQYELLTGLGRRYQRRWT
jgi:alanine racemase